MIVRGLIATTISKVLRNRMNLLLVWLEKGNL